MHRLGYALSSGTLAGVGSAAAVMAVAQREGKVPWQPLNGTSHWLWGARAGSVPKMDGPHTAVGAATHQASAMFWGAIFGAWIGRSPRPGTGEIIAKAAVTGAVAAVVDYGLVPRRATPGWEHAVSNRGVAAGFVGLAAGLALGALLVRPARQPYR